MMKVIFMGTPDFAVGALEHLISGGYEVLAVVTQPDKPKGRKKILTPPPVKETALKYGIPVLQPRRARDPEFIEQLTALSPDVIVVAAFGQILPKAILDLPVYGCMNIHASLLPKYRGAAPIQWSILDGEKETGVTIMRMNEGLDTGDMVSRVVVPITEEETGGSLFDKLSLAGAELLLETLPTLADGSAAYEKQPEESPTPYARMMTKELGRVDFHRPAVEIERQIRGLDPWPGTYTYLHGRQLKLWKSRVVESEQKGAPGEILSAEQGTLLIATGENLLEITELQLEGKKRMDTGSFLRGCTLEKGTILGDQA